MRTVLSLGIVEWKLHIRSTVFWVGLVILLLYTTVRVIGYPSEGAFLARVWISNRHDALVWLSMVLIFLIPNTIHRDMEISDIVLSTPVTPNLYLISKIVGVFLTVSTLAAIELIAQFVVRVPTFSYLNSASIQVVVSAIAAWIVYLTTVTSIYILLAVLLRGHLIPTFILCGTYLVAASTTRHSFSLFTFDPGNFASDLVYHGPQSQLLYVHRLFYLAIIPTILFGALLLFPLREKRALSHSRASVIVLSLFTLGAVIFAAGSAFVFADLRTDVVGPPSRNDQFDMATKTVTSINVQATMDLPNAHISGEVRLTVLPDSEYIDIYVPKGLTIDSATDCIKESDLVFNSINEHVRVKFSPNICLFFSGTWLPDLGSYGLYGSASVESELYTGAYIGNNYIYITPNARWFPTPIGEVERSAEYDVDITFITDAEITIIATPANVLNAEESLVERYIWSGQGQPLLGIVGGPYKLHQVGPMSVWVSTEHESIVQETTSFVIPFTELLGDLFSRELIPNQIIETPVLRWPVITPSYILLPERYFYERIADSETEYETNQRVFGEVEAYRREAYAIVRGLFHGTAVISDPSLGTTYYGADEPNTSFDYSSGYRPLEEGLIHYMSLQMTDRKFERSDLDKILRARITYSNIYLNDPAIQQNYPIAVIPGLEQPTPPYELGWAFNQMFAAIGQLEDSIGRDVVNHMISEFIEVKIDWYDLMSQYGTEGDVQEFSRTISTEVLH